MARELLSVAAVNPQAYVQMLAGHSQGSITERYVHAAQVAAEMGLAGEFASALGRAVVASIGPTTSETLRENGIRVDLEPSHPKMGFLVKEVAEKSSELLREKSNIHAP